MLHSDICLTSKEVKSGFRIKLFMSFIWRPQTIKHSIVYVLSHNKGSLDTYEQWMWSKLTPGIYFCKTLIYKIAVNKPASFHALKVHTYRRHHLALSFRVFCKQSIYFQARWYSYVHPCS
jgi:hypothetical protein